MAAPILGYEVRYRIAGSAAKWTVRQFGPDTTTLQLDGLSRGVSYEGEARSLGPNGLRSGWVPVTFTVANASLAPRAPTGLTATAVADGVALAWSVDADQRADVEYSIERGTAAGGPFAEIARARVTKWTDPTANATTYFYRVRALNFAGVPSAYSGTASAAGVSSAAILQALSDIASDNVLTPAEKSTVIADYTAITAEQAGIDAQATAYGITTEKTTYDTAVSALTTYLGALTSPVAWNNTSGNTTIVGTTFRTKFADVYSARQALLNKIVERARLSVGGGVIRNSDFDFGLTDWHSEGGAWYVAAGEGYGGGNAAHFFDPTYTGTGRLASESTITAKPGDRTRLRAKVRSFFGSGQAVLGIQYLNASGVGIAEHLSAFLSPPHNTWVDLDVLGVAPAGTIAYRAMLYVPGYAASGAWYFDAIRQEPVALDNRSLPQIMVGNGRAKVPTTITYTASAGTPATATISVGAYTVLGGDYTLTYSASSVGVTGTNGTSATYYLYMDDPNHVGGARTLVATTNGNDIYGSSGRIYVGDCTVTFPTSGGGGGGGGRDPACVCIDMSVLDGVLAGDVSAGMLLDVVDIPADATRLYRARVLGNRIVDAECVRIETVGGAVLELSADTPFDTLDGRAVWARDMLGEDVITDNGIERVVSVEAIGIRPVARISVGGVSFAAGRNPRHRIYSHNALKP